MMENVPGLARHGGDLLDSLLRKLKALDYPFSPRLWLWQGDICLKTPGL
jgi:site-specific DNA-cytosine methylase